MLVARARAVVAEARVRKGRAQAGVERVRGCVQLAARAAASAAASVSASAASEKEDDSANALLKQQLAWFDGDKDVGEIELHGIRVYSYGGPSVIGD